MLQLPNSLSIREARDVAPRLEAAIAATEVVVDGSAVSSIDTAGLQMLLALRRSIALAGGSMRWQASSEALRKSAADLNLRQELGL